MRDDDNDNIPIHYDDHIKPGHFYVINDDYATRVPDSSRDSELHDIDYAVYYCAICGGTEYHRSTCSATTNDIHQSGPAPEHPA